METGNPINKLHYGCQSSAARCTTSKVVAEPAAEILAQGGFFSDMASGIKQ